MKRKKTVFGSKSERGAFALVKGKWADRFNVYLSLPFSNIIDFMNEPLTSKEKETLLKTSVDFTLTNKQKDKPILSVEFDGIGCGFNKDGVYIPQRPTDEFDPYRKLKLDLKLRVCKEAGFPLVIVSYEEISCISQVEQMTVLDGIIGQILSRLWLSSAAGRVDFEKRKEWADKLPSPGREKAMEFIGIDTEFMTQIQWNPVFKKAAELLEEVVTKGLCTSWSAHYLSERFGPPTPERVGVKVTTHTQAGEHSSTVWLRNVNVMNIDMMEVAELIGRIRVFSDMLANYTTSSLLATKD